MLRFSVLLLATAALAQQPPISNADLRPLSAANGLEAAIRSAVSGQSGPVWIGYAVPKIPGEHNSCCWSDHDRGCGLENQRRFEGNAPAVPVKLEGPTHVPVLLRFEQGSLSKLRVFSMDCPLDAGGLPFFWLSGVKPAESVALLTGYAGQTGKIAESSVHAIAMHAAPEAAEALEKFAASGREERIRRPAIFWLGNSRGRRGYEVVSRIAREDASDKVREHAIFALTQSKEAEAIPAVIQIAKEDRSPRVRGQALFWLAQKASSQSAGLITEAIEKDPDTEVKKKAVFALSQLPKEEGIPRLIQIARNNNNPAVRKQAFFWLGQSKDPRALQFFEQVLGK